MSQEIKRKNDNSVPLAYGKLVADNEKEYFIRAQDDGQISFEIGREKRDLNDPAYFFLADSSTLSKKHAQIFWDIGKEAFYMQNLSKNKIYVEEQEIPQNGFSKPLTNMTCIMISKIRVYFLLP